MFWGEKFTNADNFDTCEKMSVVAHSTTLDPGSISYLSRM